MSQLRRRLALGWAVLAAAAILLPGCGGTQSMLRPASMDAERIVRLWWFLFAVGAVVFVVLALLLSLSLSARRERRDEPKQDDTKLHYGIGLGVAATLVLLVAIFLATLSASRPDASNEDAVMTIRVTGHMWWWQVEYLDPDPRLAFETANELRIPVGRPVLLELVAADVIHSFWVPRLAGKLDMIPGRTNELLIRASEPGRFRGQCAEFCGLQHAKMGFYVVAEEPEAFESWLSEQRRPAAPPAEEITRRGRDVFVDACQRCHIIRGVAEAEELEEVGPDLTHLATRLTLAAATLPNRKGHLGGWVANPQAIKPGNKMPNVPLMPRDFQSLLEYLQTLE